MCLTECSDRHPQDSFYGSLGESKGGFLSKLSLKGPVGTNQVANKASVRRLWPVLSKIRDFQRAVSSQALLGHRLQEELLVRAVF